MGETTTATPPRFGGQRIVLQRNLGLLRRLTDGVPTEAAMTPIVEGGSHLTWLVGHLAVARDGMLKSLGRPRVADEAVHHTFAQGSTPAAAGLPAISELLELLTTQEERLLASLEALEAAPESVADTADLERFDFLVWHETYHVGQATIYRRAAGLDSPIG